MRSKGNDACACLYVNHFQVEERAAGGLWRGGWGRQGKSGRVLPPHLRRSSSDKRNLLEMKTAGLNPSSATFYCEVLGKTLSYSEPQFPYLQKKVKSPHLEDLGR